MTRAQRKKEIKLLLNKVDHLEGLLFGIPKGAMEHLHDIRNGLLAIAFGDGFIRCPKCKELYWKDYAGESRKCGCKGDS